MSRTFLICAGAVLLMAGIALWQIGHPLELRWETALRLSGNSTAAACVRGFSQTGGAIAMISAALIGVAVLLLRRRHVEALWLFGTVATGRILVELIKNAVHRPRPDLHHQLASVSTYSFPSAHSAGSVLTIFSLLLAFRAPSFGWIVGSVFIVLIGLTRIALGVHWPSDVLAGWGFGLLWLGMALIWRPTPTRS